MPSTLTQEDLLQFIEEPEAATEESLADRLLASFVSSNFHDPARKYLPTESIGNLVTKEEILKELGRIEKGPQRKDAFVQKFNQAVRQELADWITASAQKTFAICITLTLRPRDLLLSMAFFKSYEFNDESLPLQEPQSSPPDQHPFNPKIWTPLRLEDFYEKQWRYLAPVFSPAEYNYDLSCNCIFPFTKDHASPKVGAFGSVCLVKIHKDHQMHHEMDNVAIKEIMVTRGNDEKRTNDAWDKEARALKMINILNHPHVTKCIAAIRRGDSRYFMFPWADGGSLRDYWDKFPKQTPNAELILQTIQQLRGVADALDSLHNFKVASSEIEEAVDRLDGSFDHPEVLVRDEDDDIIEHIDNVSQHSIRHGDLKPENMLRFMYQQSGLGTLKIADMGLAKQHILKTQNRDQLTSTRYGTIRYESPETVTTNQGGRSRLYDVWSMGCITLEFIIWVLHGNDALNKFHSQVRGDSQQVCQYFEITDAKEFQQTGALAKIHRVVLRWINHIKDYDPECSQDSAIRDLLNIVRERLLVVNLPINHMSITQGGRMLAPPALGEPVTRYRATAAEFREALDEILGKMVLTRTNEFGYHFTGNNRANATIPRPPVSGPNLVVIATLPATAAPLRDADRENGPNAPQEQLLTGIRGQPTKLDYTLPPLEDWEFIVDNDFVDCLLPKVNQDIFSPQKPPSTRLCSRCVSLNFWEGGFSFGDTMSGLKDRAEQCDFCKLLSTCRTDKKPPSDFVQFERIQSNLVLTGDSFPVLSIFRSPMLNTPTPIQVGLPKLPNPKSREFFQILSRWLVDCNLGHDCQSIPQRSLPTRLIDVGTVEEPKLRLIETCEEDLPTRQYIALSHPWGDTDKYKPFSTLRRDPDGTGHELNLFKQSIPYDDLPATFRDAVFCTRKLSVRYLWIDSICIIQGKDGDFCEEAKRMEDVFSGAYCVLSASRAKHQHDGFLGPRPQREYVTFQRGADKPFYVCKAIDNFSKDVIEGSLNTRGWVLQERALARRTIYFTENQAYFECGSGIRCETLTKMHNNMADFLGDPRFPEKAMRTKSRALKIEYFQNLYMFYTHLQFTEYEDRPFAVAGLEKRLLRAFNTKGGYGIFDDGDSSDGGLFHRSLLWRRKDEKVGLTPIDFPPKKDIRVPSWSWMAYQGGIEYTDPPYHSAEWEKDEIQPPWTRRGITHTDSMPRDGEIALTAVVRDFKVAGRRENEVNFSYDTERTTGSDGQRAQCVIVARSTIVRSDRERVYYVLLVAPTQMISARGEKVYKRVGAGTMLGRFITLEGSGVPAKIY
ncbi:hypothetical protein K504DRAFT_528668 [Pleomassaria siparia CBS 279.74]|uniref:Protein kinase domain-containing protein n=1 Tax=Pleomassaria siparia CBS 279.74 TaxID=1314801 RepID=A0A6G1KP47_9PLEO|nr:hypothetical protein K504DRAFT_528668 [Pleomassaria siparia CBS 279.74]